jgi:hypothetical protein
MVWREIPQGEEEAGNDVLLENTINMVVVLGNEIV